MLIKFDENNTRFTFVNYKGEVVGTLDGTMSSDPNIGMVYTQTEDEVSKLFALVNPEMPPFMNTSLSNLYDSELVSNIYDKLNEVLNGFYFYNHKTFATNNGCIMVYYSDTGCRIITLDKDGNIISVEDDKFNVETNNPRIDFYETNNSLNLVFSEPSGFPGPV